MPFVGLTGGMGAGKSTALAALERLGAAVISSDAVVHELYEDEQLREAAIERWGAEVAPGGVIDRAAVAGCSGITRVLGGVGTLLGALALARDVLAGLRVLGLGSVGRLLAAA